MASFSSYKYFTAPTATRIAFPTAVFALFSYSLKEKTKVRVTIKPKVDLEDFVMAKLPEEKIRELEERFKSEDA